jgi:hypothetical protein
MGLFGKKYAIGDRVRIKRAAVMVIADKPAQPAGSVGTVREILTKDPAYGYPLDKTYYVVDFGSSSDSFAADELGHA